MVPQCEPLNLGIKPTMWALFSLNRGTVFPNKNLIISSMLNFSLQVIFGENTCTIRYVYLYLYLYLYMPHKGSKQQELPFCYKGGHTCLHCLEEFFYIHCILPTYIFIAYLLCQTECDGRLGNQMSVYATAWVKHKVCLKRQPSHIYVDFLLELFWAPSGALVFILVYYIHICSHISDFSDLEQCWW